MKHLFSTEGQRALEAILRRAPLLAFDFDGTLAPIVDRPGDARLPPAAAASLQVLANRLPLAIVTGRRIADVRGRLGFRPRFIVGNHGAEQSGDAEPDTAHVLALAGLRAQLYLQLTALQAAGITVEDKGHSLALHYRRSPTPDLALAQINALLANLGDDLRVFGGKCVVNVAPRQAPDKADAVRALVHEANADCALFAGDDVNDEPVFASAPADWLTIRVGEAGTGSSARWRVDHPGEMAVLLERMVDLLRQA